MTRVLPMFCRTVHFNFRVEGKQSEENLWYFLKGRKVFKMCKLENEGKKGIEN